MSWIRRETEKGAVQYICPHCHDYHEFREDFGERTFSENYIFCRRCGARNGTGTAPTLTPPNERLTLEQLRKMDGQPVWVKVIGKTGIRCDGWCEVEIREKDPFAYVWWPGSEVEDIAKIEDYGKTWACYAYPPARIDREAWEPCGVCESCGNCHEAGKATGEKINYAHPCHSCLNGDNFRPVAFCRYCGRPLTEEAWAELDGKDPEFITDLLARAEAEEARVRELETSFRTEKCENGPECVELGRVRKALAEAEARAEKAESERDAAVSDL